MLERSCLDLDTPEILGGETWEQPSGHSGTRQALPISLAMVASFLLAGVSRTFGPRMLLRIRGGLLVVLGVYSLAAHSWVDYAHDGARSEHS